MSFPAVAYTTPTAAQAALANAAQANGLGAIVLDGQDAVQDAVLANLMTELPASTIVGGAAAAAGAGTAGTGTIVKSSVIREGELIITRLFVDLTGLAAAAAGDVIGKATGGEPSFITRLTTAVNGTIVGGRMLCTEAPAGGDTDIDVYVATAATGKYDDAVSGLAGQTQVINAGTQSLGTASNVIADTIGPDEYVYLVSVGATAAAYTAGRLYIELIGV